MKKEHVLLVLFLIIFIATILLINNNQNNGVCIENKKCFSVTLAETLKEKQIGLSETRVLLEDEGMFFVYSNPTQASFWMKEMNFSIDIIWIDENLEIIGVEKNLEPCQNEKVCKVFYSPQEILYILEINSGLSEDYDFELGDRIFFW